MHIIVLRTHLLTVLKRAGAACNPSDMIAVRQCVLIVAELGEEFQQTVTIGATDGPLGVICGLPGEIKTPGRAVLNHRRIAAIVNELPEDGGVEIKVDQFKVTVKSTSSKRKFTMTSHDPVDFPPLLGETAGEPLYAVESKILQQAASEVMFGIEKSRIDGVLLAPMPDGTRFQLVSLSGHSMAVATGWFTKSTSKEDCLLPRNLLDAIGALAADQTELVISQDDKKISVTTKDTLIFGARLVGTFPAAWEKVMSGIPKEKRFKVSSEKFVESVKAVSVAADIVEGSYRFIQIDVRYQNQTCIVSTKRSEKNQGEDELDVLEGAAGECVVHIDGQLLTQALRSFEPAELDLYYEVTGGSDPLYLKNENLQIMLMPVTVIEPKAEKK